MEIKYNQGNDLKYFNEDMKSKMTRQEKEKGSQAITEERNNTPQQDTIEYITE